MGHQLSPKPKPAHSTPNTYMLWWCGACQNNPKKREGKALPSDAFFSPIFWCGAQDVKRLLSQCKCGSPGTIIAGGGWFFSLISDCSRHFHKNVYCNNVYRNKSWDEWSDGEDKSKQRINHMQQPIKCIVHCLPQETSTVLHGWSSLMPNQPKFYTTDTADLLTTEILGKITQNQWWFESEDEMTSSSYKVAGFLY